MNEVLKLELQGTLCKIAEKYNLNLRGMELNITEHNGFGRSFDIDIVGTIIKENVDAPIDKSIIMDFIEAYLVYNEQVKHTHEQYSLVKRLSPLAVRLSVF